MKAFLLAFFQILSFSAWGEGSSGVFLDFSLKRNEESGRIIHSLLLSSYEGLPPGQDVWTAEDLNKFRLIIDLERAQAAIERQNARARKGINPSDFSPGSENSHLGLNELTAVYGLNMNARAPLPNRLEELRELGPGVVEEAAPPSSNNCGEDGSTCVLRPRGFGVCLDGHCRACNAKDPDFRQWPKAKPTPYEPLSHWVGECDDTETSCRKMEHLSCNSPYQCTGQAPKPDDTDCLEPIHMVWGCCVTGTCFTPKWTEQGQSCAEARKLNLLPVREAIKEIQTSVPFQQGLPAGQIAPAR